MYVTLKGNLTLNQIININPPIYRNDIIDDYETTMLKIVNYIYENEAKKIHYEIPANIGIYKDTTGAVYSYKYKNELYITYDKRNSPINYFKNTNSEYLCKKICYIMHDLHTVTHF